MRVVALVEPNFDGGDVTTLLEVPSEMNLRNELTKWWKWYHKEYVPGRETVPGKGIRSSVKYVDFIDYLKSLGAVDHEVETFEY